MERTTKNCNPDEYAAVEKACQHLLAHLADGRKEIEIETPMDRIERGWTICDHMVAAELMRLLVEKIGQAEPRIGATVATGADMAENDTGWWPHIDENGICDG